MEARLLTDTGPADWLADLPSPVFDDLSTALPSLGRTVRVFHPFCLEVDDAPSVTWAEIARREGTTAHPLMQSDRVARWPLHQGGELRLSDGTPFDTPLSGRMQTPDLHRFASALGLAAGCRVGDPVLVAVWVGWGDHQGWPHDHTVHLWGRQCLLFETVWTRAEESVVPAWPDGVDDPAPPMYWWPPDRSWCVFTELDFDSTVVSGPSAMCDVLLGSPDLETALLPPDADLTDRGDRVNPDPRG